MSIDPTLNAAVNKIAKEAGIPLSKIRGLKRRVIYEGMTLSEFRIRLQFVDVGRVDPTTFTHGRMSQYGRYKAYRGNL